VGMAPSIALGSRPAGSAPGEAPDESKVARDDFGFDPQLRQLVLPFFRFLHDKYFRAEVTGARNVPAEGPAILVANHSGAIPIDGAMLCTTVELHCGRSLRFLYDRFVEALAPVAMFYRKVGGAVATKDSAEELLAAGEMVLIFPEGVPGVAKPFAD